jgi:hypothetical protein
MSLPKCMVPKPPPPAPKAKRQIKRSRIKPKPRSASEYARIYGSDERREWVQEQPCIVLSREHVGRIQNAHIENEGISRKGHYTKIVAACLLHHNEMHRGQESFEAKYGINLKHEAEELEKRWQSHTLQDR